MKRRDFIQKSALLGGSALISTSLPKVIFAKDEFDTLLLNGIIIDGSGRKRYKADVGIKNGFITEIGSLKSANAKNIIFQPEWNKREFAQQLAVLIKERKCNVKMILQQHKVIWGNERGV